jgi:hypothetical protein
MQHYIMIKKNSLLGQRMSTKELKSVKGGIGRCGEYQRTRCTYAYSTFNACCDWAISLDAIDFTFDSATCRCCATIIIDLGPCDGFLIP